VTTIAGTDLDVFPLCLGTNIFGWTADEEESFALLDAYAEAGGNFIDTADVYSAWVDGHSGGESEAVIGRWLASRGRRDDMVIATKVGGAGGLGERNIRERVQASLRRLQTDRIDVYYAHFDDAETPLEETLATFDALVRAGSVRYVAASNYKPERLADALAVSEREGLARFVALSPHYNLLERGYETTLAPLAAEHDLACVPYYGLAKGFLTGKYRPGAEASSGRGRLDGSAYLDDRGVRVLAALDEVAAAHETTVAAVALAWLRAQPTVVAPVASARTPEQLADLLPAAELALGEDELERLAAASEPAPA
jgi:aryl-alcohol dehydrogenase-like predicted oxidoreductase